MLQILRLKHNLTPPYTGLNRHTTPWERAGYRSRYDDYLDALFPPNGRDLKQAAGGDVQQFTGNLDASGVLVELRGVECRSLLIREIQLKNDGKSLKIEIIEKKGAIDYG